MSDGAGSDALIAHSRVHRDLDRLDGPALARIVSLVPSLSEALVVLGLGDRLVAVTEYCVHPAGAFATLPKVGGTKDADVEAIIDLRPDLVIANHEENTARVVRQLVESEIDVWLTYPRTVREGAALLRALAGLGADSGAILRWVAPVERALEAAMERRSNVSADSERGPRVFCPIWRDPWMTIGRDTYIHDLIELCGGVNLYGEPRTTRTAGTTKSDAARAAPVTDAGGAADRRYPIVELEHVERLDPEVILLPDEPYAFAEVDRKALSDLDCAAARDARIHLIDGTLVSWYGTRIAEAIRVLAKIFANP